MRGLQASGAYAHHEAPGGGASLGTSVSDEQAQLHCLAELLIVKDVHSPERLLDETVLFLHRSEARLPDVKRNLLEKLDRSSPATIGKKVLIVDDDMRNIFALTSALERHQMHILNAESLSLIHI